jgi:hypothetical protein
MAHYLLSVHTGAAPREPMTEEAARRSWERIQELEDGLRAEGAWVFSGRLSGPDAASVVRASGGEVVTTDGPYAEAKEHVAGFYVIEAEDLEAARGWAARTSECIGMPIELRPFAAVALE